ncbi:MAG: SPFH domain-containing protein [Planctomycetota bacterium]
MLRRLFVPRRGEVLCGLLLAPIAFFLTWSRVSGSSGFAVVEDDELALVESGLSGERRVHTMPGVYRVLPWLEKIYRFDKAPRAIEMSGDASTDDAHLRRLVVRAKDGSSFSFGSLTVIYAIQPEQAGTVLDDGGADGARVRELVPACARAILAEEFGHYATEDVVRTEVVQSASRAAFERMNAALAPHGITVLEVSTPRPTFDVEYETQIGRRKMADQEVERLRAELERLAGERDQREARTRKEKEIETRALEVTLVRDIATAKREAFRLRSDAQTFALERRSAAAAVQQEKERQVEALQVKYTGECEDLEAELVSLARCGDLAVREALVEKLGQIEISLAPSAEAVRGKE